MFSMALTRNVIGRSIVVMMLCKNNPKQRRIPVNCDQTLTDVKTYITVN